MDGIFAFPPQRHTLGGTSYFIVGEALGLSGNLLIDCPDSAFQPWCQAQGGIQYLLLTHRDGADRIPQWQATFGCPVVTQQQEAYLYPGVWVRPFAQTLTVVPDVTMIWTPGYSPGSSCIYLDRLGGVLFTGRHLLPNPQGELSLIRTRTTFHWPRQQRSMVWLQTWLGERPVQYFCPGANTGFLRGRGWLRPASPTAWYNEVRREEGNASAIPQGKE
ncbi:MBL fold metallo-hydrolase [Gloeomargarita sp.]